MRYDGRIEKNDGRIEKNRTERIEIRNDAELSSLSGQIRILIICSNIGNSVRNLDLNRCVQMTRLEIQDECFMNVDQFDLDGLNSLQSIKIGNKSFTTEKDWHCENKSRHFCIKNCKQLESIQIGRYSFSDYSGQFQLTSIV